MGISSFKLKNKDKAIQIPMEKITLTERIHQWGVYTPKEKPPEDLLIIVRKNDDSPTYSLVCGWADYMEAKAQHLEKIRCIVTEENRAVFMRRYNNRHIRTDNIIIQKCFAKTTPSPEKVKVKTEYYEKHGRFAKPITVNRDYILVDGYIDYLIAKEKGINRLYCEIR